MLKIVVGSVIGKIVLPVRKGLNREILVSFGNHPGDLQWVKFDKIEFLWEGNA